MYIKYGIALKSNDSSIEFSDNSQLKSLLHRIASEKIEKEKIKSASSRTGVHVLAYFKERERKKEI